MATPPFVMADIVTKVRTFMRDNASVNALLFGEETSDLMIELAVELTTDDFSNTTPLIGEFTLNNIPSLYILVYGSVIQVLKSAGILQSRNNLNYSDGGVTVASSDKTMLYQSWIDRFYQDYEVKKKQIKVQMNAEQCYSVGMPSEYAYLGFGSTDLQYGIY